MCNLLRRSRFTHRKLSWGTRLKRVFNLQQCFICSRNISQVTPEINHLHSLKKAFLDQGIQKNIKFKVETTRTNLQWVKSVKNI